MMERDRTYDIVEYVNFCVAQFANQYKLRLTRAYAYLRRFGAIAFLMERYDAEHTLSIEEALQDMKEICSKNGGRIV